MKKPAAPMTVTVRADRSIAPAFWASVATEGPAAFPASCAALLFGAAESVEVSRTDAAILLRNASTIPGYPMTGAFPLVCV